jgi:hypothetical protein
MPSLDLVVVDGLLEFLSERWATSVLSFCRSILQAWGSVVVATMPPTPDEPFFRAVLDYPTIRRTPAELELVMVHAGFESQLRPQGVNDPAVITAMSLVPREEFVPDVQRQLAYVDGAVPLGDGRALPAAVVTGLLLTVLAPMPGQTALAVSIEDRTIGPLSTTRGGPNQPSTGSVLHRDVASGWPDPSPSGRGRWARRASPGGG